MPGPLQSFPAPPPPSEPRTYAQVCEAGQAEGARILAMIRAAAGVHNTTPIARMCPRCHRVWPFGTVAYEHLARARTCPVCAGNTQTHTGAATPPPKGIK